MAEGFKTLDYGDGPKPVVASILTLEAYEQEFYRDLIGDLWGVVRLTEKDLAEAMGEPREDGEISLTIDYTDISWTALVRALWACMKTADPSLPRYDAWKESVGSVNLMAVRSSLLPMLNDGLFLAGAADTA